VARVKSLKEEISVLLKERETLKSNSILINKDLEEYSGRVEKTQALRTLLQSSLSNTEDWLLQAKSQKSSEVLEEDLVEFRNDYAKEYLKTLASEKALEATVQVLIDSMHKNQTSFKEGVPQIKSLFIEIFLSSRLKEKFLALSS
jgi:pantothenate kinase-related protein Tda10